MQYTSATIDRALLDAALLHKAYNPDQVRQVLRAEASLEEVKDGVGRPTGAYAPMVKMRVPTEDGKSVTEEVVTPEKAVEILKGMPKYDNLFLSERAGGTGFRPAAGGAGGAGNSNLSSNQKIAAGLKNL